VHTVRRNETISAGIRVRERQADVRRWAAEPTSATGRSAASLTSEIHALFLPRAKMAPRTSWRRAFWETLTSPFG
jgi:hypothetical protein